MVRFLACLVVGGLALPLVMAQDGADKGGDAKPLNIKAKLDKDDPGTKLLRGNPPHKTYPYTMKKGQIYVIDAISKDFDTFVYVQNPDGKPVAFDDDSGGDLNARLVYKAKDSGEHKISVTSVNGKTGEFTLTVRQGTAEDLAKADPFYPLLNKKAPDITGEFAINGTAKKLSDLKGKVVLVDFWAVWCGPCISTFPHLREWSKEFKDKGFEILGVTTYYEKLGFDKEAGRIKPLEEAQKPEQEHTMLKDFAAHHKLTHELLVVSKDSWQKAGKDYRVRGIPEVVLVDRKGVVRMVRVGAGEENAKALEAEIRKLLAEK